MHYELRIISGSLRGRKLKVIHDPQLRPMTDRVRGALFSILGNAVPDRPFFDVFAGSGAVGLEALSRSASKVVFVEKEGKSVIALQKHLAHFGVEAQSQVLQADAYRWGEKGALPAEPANVFLGPPYPEFERNERGVRELVGNLMERLAPESTLTVQAEKRFPTATLPGTDWDLRQYGRTQIAIWVKPAQPS